MAHLYVELSAAEGGLPFFNGEPRRVFLERLSRLGRRWRVLPLAFRFEPATVRVLLQGESLAMAHLVRLAQSGHGAWSRTHGVGLRWEPALRVGLPSERGLLRQLVGTLHSGPGALEDPWSSLWDALGLRLCPWFDPAPLHDLGPVRGWLEDLGLPPLRHEPVRRPEWALVEQAAWAALGELPPGRAAAGTLALRVGVACGYSPQEAAALRGIALASALRRLREPTPLAVVPALRLLGCPPIRASLAQGRWPDARVSCETLPEEP